MPLHQMFNSERKSPEEVLELKNVVCFNFFLGLFDLKIEFLANEYNLQIISELINSLA